MKTKRQAALMTIIRSAKPHTQEALIEALKDKGFEVTQATVSRDIKDLRLVKKLMPDGKSYTYAVPEETAGEPEIERLEKIFRESVKSAEPASFIVVIKTLPGMASGACALLDAMPELGIVGTNAGDDTAALYLKDEDSRRRVLKYIDGVIS